MDLLAKANWEDELSVYLEGKQVDAYFKTMAERLLHDLPSDPIQYLIDFWKHRWDGLTVFVIFGEDAALDQELLAMLQQRNSRFDYFVCDGASAASQIKTFLNKSNDGRNTKFVFNFPRSLQDMELIRKEKLFFDKVIWHGDKPSKTKPQPLYGQYKSIAVKMGKVEIYDYLKARS